MNFLSFLLAGLLSSAVIAIHKYQHQLVEVAPVESQRAIKDHRMDISPACQPTFKEHNSAPIERIVLTHMRKAGGTTLRSYLGTVTQFYGLQLAVQEAGASEAPGTHNNTLYVTHLRDPSTRSIRHFQYQGRWLCRDLARNQSFVATADNANHLTDWIRHDFPEPSCTFDRKLWLCSSNCYIKWLNYDYFKGQPLCVNDYNLTDSSFVNRTIETLHNYNLIVASEDLSNRDYAERLERFFGVPGLAGLRVDMFCGKESKRANEQFPLEITSETREEVRKRNSWDYRVYDTVMNCPSGFGRLAHDKSLADFVHKGAPVARAEVELTD